VIQRFETGTPRRKPVLERKPRNRQIKLKTLHRRLRPAL